MNSPSDVNVTYVFGDFELESSSRTLRSRITGSNVPLTSRAFDLLLLFVRRPNVPITKRELIDSLWPQAVVEDGNLDQAVFALRHALGDRRGEHRYIKTIHRRGYQFSETVTVIEAGSQLRGHEVATSAPKIELPAQPGRHTTRTLLAAAVLIIAAALLWLVASQSTQRSAATHAPATQVRSDRFAILYFRASQDAAGVLLADTMTRLLHERFSAIPALTVLGYGWRAQTAETNVSELGKKANARYLLHGSVRKSGDNLHVEVVLEDVKARAALWSQTYERPVTELTSMREDIVAHATAALRVDPAVTNEAVKAPVSFEVYQLYCRAKQLIDADATIEEMEQATALFSRTTTLDPRFARGYLGVSEALLFASYSKPRLSSTLSPDIVARARAAVDRALELNPAFAEAMVERARLMDDPTNAEQTFRQGLHLAPNYGVGSLHYANFLFDRDRQGEAMDVLRRARELDPLAVWLYTFEAQHLMMSRSDVEGSEKLIRQALAIYPDYKGATRDLAVLLLLWRGEFAEAIRLMEGYIDSENGNRAVLSTAYLDVDDLDAAVQVWNEAKIPPAFQLMVLSRYRRDVHAAARVGRAALSGGVTHLYGRAAESIRDEAIATGQFAAALTMMQPVFAAHPWSGSDANADPGFAIPYAHLLILSGQVPQGRELARSLLVSIDAAEIGRPAHWFGRERAALLTLLGQDDLALEELAAIQKLNLWSEWWYTGEINPIFARLHHDPRFQVLVENARHQRAQQRELVENMRRNGLIPMRGATHVNAAAASAANQ
ncbi:MAG: winged helix-turn-helix domain-containing tetratricopeptide repeat protein [Povalibacter sp.]